MGDDRIKMVIPVLPALLASSEIQFVGMEKELFGNFIPFA